MREFLLMHVAKTEILLTHFTALFISIPPVFRGGIGMKQRNEMGQRLVSKLARVTYEKNDGFFLYFIV